MSNLTRSLKNVQGDLTVTDGDVIITDKDSGLILTNQSDVAKRITMVEDGGQDTLEINNA